MTIIEALLVCLAVKAAFAADLECPNPVTCPCGSKGKNVTICVPPTARDEVCTRLLKCETCEDGLNFCSKCPEGLEGPFCSQEIRKSRQKRQWVRGRQPSYQPSYQRPYQQRYPTAQSSRSRCPTLESPKLGSIRCVSSEQYQTCTGKCLPGYGFDNAESQDEIVLTCQGGYWTPRTSFPACKSGGYCDLVVQGAGSFNCTTGMDGTRCDVHCYGRYMGRFFCYPGRSWEPNLPRCVRPKEIEEARNCDSHGHCECPDGRTGVLCEITVPETTCRDPGFIPNGFRRFTDNTESSTRQDFKEGQSVVYGCTSEEYALRGSSLLTCKQDGTWSSPLPKCIRPPTAAPVTVCPDPGQVANAERLNSDGSPSVGVQQYRVGQSVVYTCHPGFALQRRSLITCLSSGAWSFRTPYCTRIMPTTTSTTTTAAPVTTCPDPGQVANAERLNSDGTPSVGVQQYRVGQSVVYTCHPGFALQRRSLITCLSNGAWSFRAPYCTLAIPTSTTTTTARPVAEKLCPNPGVDPNGIRQPGTSPNRRGFPHGTRLKYSCKQGYNLSGETSIYCLTTGSWSATRPRCEMQARNPVHIEPNLAYCENPGGIPNGQVVYYPNINGRRPQPTELTDPEYPEGSRLQYSCNEGFTLVGRTPVVCEKSGIWSAEPPICRRDSVQLAYCKNPGTVANARVLHIPLLTERRLPQEALQEEYPEGSSLRYSCEEGYILMGPPSLICEKTGNWSPETLPTCVLDEDPLYCGNPGRIQNGRMRYFQPPGEQPRTHPGGRLDYELDEYEVGSTLQYFCNSGFRLQGTNSLTCEASGFWSEAQPTCVRAPSELSRLRYCKYPGDIANGRMVHFPAIGERRRPSRQNVDEIQAEYPDGSRLQYSCEEGYTLNGPEYITCQNTGTWSPAEPPRCEIAGVSSGLNCENPGLVLNARVWYISPEVQKRNGLGVLLTKEMNEYPEGSALEYACDKGFRLVGADGLICQSNGFWSAARPTCVGDCGQTFIKTSVRIRDGQETVVGEWPWVVSISLQEDNSSRFICGGAVFNTRSVVTAAHCLEEGRTYILRFGKHHFRIEDDDSEVLVRKSVKVIVHPDYSDKSLDSDIGLILFQPRIEYSVRVQPICLPTFETTVRNLMTGKIGYVSGWGDTELELPSDTLLFAGLPILSTQDCLESYKNQSMNISITGNMFCAGFYNGTYSVCGGDSGSPFVFYDSEAKRYTLEGLVSFVVRSRQDAQACGLPGRFAIFTKVFRFVPWMYQNIA